MSLESAQIIESLYAGTLDDTAWNRALIGIADSVRASGGLLLAFSPKNGEVLRDENHRCDPQVLDDYRRHWAVQDPRVIASANIQAGRPMTEETLAIPEWRQTSIMQEFLVRADCPHMMATWIKKTPAKAVALSLQGTRRRGPFGARDLEYLSTLLPHLGRALEIRDRLQAAAVRADTLTWCVDRVNFGVIVLDAHARILEANAAGRQIINNSAAALTTPNGFLTLGEPAGSRLKQLLTPDETAARAGPGRQDHLIHIDRGFDRRPITAVLTPMPELPVRWVSGDPRGILFLFDPEHQLVPRSETLMQELGISPREAEIAVLLTLGSDLPQVAKRMHISIHTARTHLKNIYAKTGITSQAELVRRVATGPSAHAHRI